MIAPLGVMTKIPPERRETKALEKGDTCDIRRKSSLWKRMTFDQIIFHCNSSSEKKKRTHRREHLNEPLHRCVRLEKLSSASAEMNLNFCLEGEGYSRDSCSVPPPSPTASAEAHGGYEM